MGKSVEKSSFGLGFKRFLKALVLVPKEDIDRDIEKIKADRKKRKKPVRGELLISRKISNSPHTP